MERIWSRGDAAEQLKGLAFLVGYLEDLPGELRGRVARDLRAIARIVEDPEPLSGEGEGRGLAPVIPIDGKAGGAA
ncbi:MAG: hypothetical protein K2X35_09610 [Bryobacteraceae bacterium]|nr:hypothetical protein [Bryobacteraceae bacterium]